MKTLRIFISSPGDVAEERDKARQVIADLQRRYEGLASLIPVLWEDLAIPATASFQAGIDYVLADGHRIDVAVFILWSRLGSPLGGAIKKPDGSPYLSGTEREFDLMLKAFEQSGGQVPIILAYTRRDEEGFSNRLDATKQGDDALEEILIQRKLVKRFIRENFQDKEGHNIRAYHNYREPVGFAQRLHIHLREAIENLLELDTTIATWADAPYRSLEVFDVQHAPIFYGRDEETCDLLQRLRDQQRAGCAFVCIVGASGSGKSSLARAGVAATLMQRSFEVGVKDWCTAILVPSLAEGDLPQALASTLAEALPRLRTGIGGLEEFTTCLRDLNFKAATLLLATAFNGRPQQDGGRRVLVILDQMEELWTDRNIAQEDRERFLQTVEALARTSSITVLATLRSDYYPQAQLSEAFLRMKGEHGHFDLTPPGPAAVQQLIVQPARRAGLRFERDHRTGRTLDQKILDDATSTSSNLPLLQYALTLLYELGLKQSPYAGPAAVSMLRFEDYEALGGVGGAIDFRAQSVVNSVPQEAKTALDDLLPLLVGITDNESVSANRRRCPMNQLGSTGALGLLVARLVEARFLTTDQIDTVPVVMLAHEALLSQWKRLADWIDLNKSFLRMRSNIESGQRRWADAKKDPSLLLPPGLPLEEGALLLQKASRLLVPEVVEYIDSSINYYTASARRTARVRRNVIMTLISSTAIALSAFAWALRKQADEAAAKALSQFNERRAVGALEALLKERAAAYLSALEWLAGDGFDVAPPRDPVQISVGQLFEFELGINRGFEYAFLAQPVGDDTGFEFAFSVEDETGREMASAGSSLCRWFHVKSEVNGSVTALLAGKKGTGSASIVVCRRMISR